MKFGEKTIKKHSVYEGKIINVRCDEAELPDGRPCKRELVEHLGGAAVVCEFGGKIAFVRQYRYAYGEELLEIPAGKLEKGEDPMLAAMRELSEETGFRAERLSLLTVLYPSPGYTNEKIYLYAAHGVTRGESRLDEGEFLDLEMIPAEEAFAMAQNGVLRDAKSVAALLLYKSIR